MILALFDVDGTLTVPRKPAAPDMLAFLQRLRGVPGVHVGIVGGSDLAKIKEQLGEGATEAYDWVFAENGLVAYRGGRLLARQDIRAHFGEARLQELINFCLRYVADLAIPVKRGCFLEFRSGMLNVSPIGRNCSQEERDAFEAYDALHGVRAAFIAALQARFADLDLACSVGGQISFDVFPRGWDKTYALSFVEREYDTIHFFGDKTHKGGNDHEIYADRRTVGHQVRSPEDTRALCEDIFLWGWGAPAPA